MVAGSKTVMYFEKSSGNVVGAYLSVQADGTLKVQFTGNNATAQNAFSGFSVNFGGVYYFQFYVQVSTADLGGGYYSATYLYSVYVNGIVRLSGSATVTPCTPVATGVDRSFNSVGVASPDGWVGDIWFTDGELLGDVKIVPLWPRANGSVNQWTPLAGSNYTQVNTHTVGTDTASYNYDASVGDLDQYYMDTIGSFTGTILGAQALWRVANDLTGDTAAVGVYYNGTATVTASLGTFAPSSTFWSWFIDPNRKSVFNTSSNFTPAEIDAMQVGIKRVA